MAQNGFQKHPTYSTMAIHDEMQCIFCVRGGGNQSWLTHLGASLGSCHGSSELVTLVAPLGPCLTLHSHHLVCMAGDHPPRPPSG